MRKQRQSIPDRLKSEVVAEYLAGKSTVDLACRYGVTPPTVACLLKKRSISLRSRSEINRLRAPVDEKRLQSLTDEAKLSQWEIAEELGVSLPTVERTLRRLGLRSKKGRGSPMEKNFFWRGGRTRDVDGYVLVKAHDHPFADNRGYVREHRLVMEKKLGRYLDPKEIVHHLDGVHDNNDPDNLEVYATNAEHLKEELVGKTPNYTPEGLQRMRENALRLNRRKYASTQAVSKSDAHP
jgi:transposase-like protein